MVTIILESVLFVVLVATVAALFFYVVMHHTPFGQRSRQVQNRRRIEREADTVCPIHGAHSEQDLVRLPSGETMCPVCYQETFHGRLD